MIKILFLNLKGFSQMDNKDPAQALQEDLSFQNMFKIMCWNSSRVAAEYLQKGQIRQINYGEYEKMTVCAAYQIARQIGGDKGRFVGLKLDNCPQWPVVFWAILMAGYKPVLLDFRLDEHMTNHLLSEAGAAAIICSGQERLSTGVRLIRAELLWTLQTDVPADWDFVWADEMAFCTSGSTATAKIYVYDGPAMSHNLLNQDQVRKAYPGSMPEGDVRVLAFLPFHHIYGFTASYLPNSVLGKTMVYLKDRAPSSILEACQRHRVTHIYSVPILWNNLASSILQEVEQSPYKTAIVFFFMSDKPVLTAVIPPNRAQAGFSMDFLEVYKVNCWVRILICCQWWRGCFTRTLRVINAIGYNLICGFGMTEAGLTSMEMRHDIKKKLGASLGQALGTLEYKLVPAAGIDTPGVGELYIKGPSLHSARLEQGCLLPPLRDKDGWFASGDIAAIKDGTLWLKGRLKEVIINESGENVYPDEIEECFSGMKSAEQICVVGLNNNNLYEDISLVLFGRDVNGNDLLQEMIGEIYRINIRLPIYKRVNRVLLSSQPLPLANNMKIPRLKLKELIESDQWPYVTLDIDHYKEDDKTKIKNVCLLGMDEPAAANELDHIKLEIKKCIADVLLIPPQRIRDEAHFINELGGDSLWNIELLLKLEELYDTTLPDEEFYACTNVNELSALLYKVMQGKGNENSKETL
jgi:acyl carrier protein